MKWSGARYKTRGNNGDMFHDPFFFFPTLGLLPNKTPTSYYPTLKTAAPMERDEDRRVHKRENKRETEQVEQSFRAIWRHSGIHRRPRTCNAIWRWLTDSLTQSVTPQPLLKKKPWLVLGVGTLSQQTQGHHGMWRNIFSY